jgi:hypothetical protein
MTTKMYLTEPEGPVIEPSLILKFLIKRFNEVLASGHSKVPFLLQGLALAGLAGEEELVANYKGVLSSPHLPPIEIIRRAVEIFQLALKADPDSHCPQRPADDDEEDHEPDEKYCRQIMMNAIREGRQMLEEGDDCFPYVQVFVMLGWIALSRDPLRQVEFEAACNSFADDPQGLLKAGMEILKDAFFRRNRH